MLKTLSFILTLICPALLANDNWPGGAGPNGNFQVKSSAPTEWSVVQNKNIIWRHTKPETGQSIPVIYKDKIFFSTMKPVSEDTKLGKNSIAWCIDAKTGAVIWQQPLSGTHFSRLSGCFTDNSAPPALCDGERVVFINSSGSINCFSLAGKVLWKKEQLSVGRTLPFLHKGSLVYTRQVYRPNDDGNFPHKYKDSPREMWTQLQALDMKTGNIVWTGECGVNMGSAIIKQKLNDGTEVIVCGRGGGHGPPEKPEGISLINADDGTTRWTLPLEKFMATQTFSIRDNKVHLFHENEHLTVDALTGKIVSRTDILKEVSVCRFIDGQRVNVKESIKKTKSRMITQTSNLLVGKFHYFRSYTKPYLGRVNVDTGKVEYLELPLQLSRSADKDDYKWYDPNLKDDTKKKKPIPIQFQYFKPNDLKNSRGFTVFADPRSKGNGWGHVAAPVPSVAGDYIYIPVMSGTVYVIKWNCETLDEGSIAAINDLGPSGGSFTRASLSFAHGKIFAHTIKEIICIGK